MRESPPLGEKWRVEEARERRDRTKDCQHVAVEPVGCRELRLELSAGQILLESQVLAGWMILDVSPRNACQPLTLEGADRLAEGLPGDDSTQSAMVCSDVLAYRPQVRRRRHVDSAANPDPLRRDLEIQPGTLVAAEAAGWKVRGDMRLQRSFVRAEPCIAIDPVQGHTRVGDELRGERRQIGRQSGEQVRHRRPNVLVVLQLPAPEPFAVVVALQRAEKCKGLACERGPHDR